MSITEKEIVNLIKQNLKEYVRELDHIDRTAEPIESGAPMLKELVDLCCGQFDDSLREHSEKAVVGLQYVKTAIFRQLIDQFLSCESESDDGSEGANSLPNEDSIWIPQSVNRFEVIDYGRETPREVVSMTARGGTLMYQDDGRTAKLFIESR